MKYKVQQLFAGGWDDAPWTVTNPDGVSVQMRFNSIVDAQMEIDDFIKDCQDSAELGELDYSYERNEFRVVPAEE